MLHYFFGGPGESGRRRGTRTPGMKRAALYRSVKGGEAFHRHRTFRTRSCFVRSRCCRPAGDHVTPTLPPARRLEKKRSRKSRLTSELTVVVGAGGVLLVGAERRAGGGAGAEAGVAQGRAHLAGLAAVVDWPLDVQGRGQGGALLGLGKRNPCQLKRA